MGWQHLSYNDFKDFFGDLGLTAWVKFNWLAEVPDGFNKVDLGTLEWTYYETYQYFYTDIEGAEGNDSGDAKIMCAMYENKFGSTSSMPNMTMQLRATGPTLYVKNESYTSASAFAEGMKGVWLIYKKA